MDDLEEPPASGLALAGVRAKIARTIEDPTRAAELLGEVLEEIERIERRAAESVQQPDWEQQIEVLTDVIIDIASLDFSHRIETGGLTRGLDVIGQGLSALGEELKHSVVSRTYLEKITASMRGMLLVTDRQFRVQTVNPSTISGLEYPESELVGQSLQRIMTPEAAAQMAQAAKDGRSPLFAGDTHLLCSGGTLLPVHLSVSFLEGDGDPEPVGVVCVAHDISDRVRAERELQRYREHLEDLVRERTRDLEKSHDDLLRAERLAVLGQVVATVAHEIRNPLGTIQNSLFVLEQNAALRADPRSQRAVDRASRNIRRCDKIVEELLDFTRARTARPIATPLDSWLREVLDELDLPADITVSEDFTLGGLRVLLDRDRMRQAVVNVVANARDALSRPHSPDAGPRPGAKLTVATRLQGGRVEMSVTDNGVGIPENVLPRVYEPLFSTKSFGVGLGMAVVGRVLKEHDGGVVIDSVVGEGTTITLWLPSDAPSMPDS